jgi:CDP-diacylglycerol--glycerol-3-phosphate 3-phosphatidyltransferase
MKVFVNMLSGFRFLAAIVLIPLSFLQLWGAALILFILASVSDFLDGFLARKFNVCTKLGGVMDQISDKFLTTVALLLLMLAVQTPLCISLVTVLILRELYVSGLREFIGSQKMEMPVPKNRFALGKIKTTMQMLALSVMFVFFWVYTNDFWINYQSIILNTGLILLGVAVLFSVLSAAQYTITFAQKVMPAKVAKPVKNKKKK